ncbi:hypothetical protein FKW77_002499 [Venturia effusa]|uniref:Uncharacterized protein n=1 Tax=Venturia effusa TaxID=50376 RepID=A0A517LC17_9PEZI|nr:hypothetical protein FKW77_002499 [Venturia effusa]
MDPSQESQSQLKYKNDLHLCLSGDQQSFLSFASKPCHVYTLDPMILIKSLGRLVPLPFNPDEAMCIATLKRCRRNALSQDEIEFQNPDWQNALSEIVVDTSKELGIIGSISAQNCRLVTCSQGASLDLLESRDRPSNMVATLVILLPSCHSGGQIVFGYNKQIKSVKTAERHDSGIKAFAWYSDVVFKSEPIKSEYLMALSYDLVSHQASRQDHTDEALDKVDKKLAKLLRKWHNVIPTQGKIIHVLAGKYSKTPKLKVLKGKDMLMGQRILNVCSVEDLSLFFGTLNRRIPQMSDGQLLGEELWLTDVRDTEGYQVACPSDVQTTELLTRNIFNNKPDDIEKYDEHSNDDNGRWVTSDSTWKKQASNNTSGLRESFIILTYAQVMVIIPHAMLSDYLISSQLSSDQYSATVRTSLWLKSEELFVQALKHPDYNKHGAESAGNVLNDIVTFLRSPSERKSPDFYLKMMHIVISATKPFKAAFELLSKVRVDLKSSLDTELVTRASLSTLDQCLLSQISFDDGDVSSLVELIEQQDASWAINSLLPLLITSSTSDFKRNLLLALSSRTTVSVVANILRKYFSDFIQQHPQAFEFTIDDLGANSQRVTAIGQRKFGLNQEFLSIFQMSAERILSSKVLLAATPPVLHATHTEYAITKLSQLISRSDAVPIKSSSLFVTMLRSNVQLLKRPAEPRNWSKIPSVCERECIHCRLVARFIKGPDEQVQTFEMLPRYCEHVRSHYKRENDLAFHLSPGSVTDTMTITKSNSRYRRKYRRWRDNIDALEKIFEPLRTDYMKKVLGALYSDLVMLKDLKRQAAIPTFTLDSQVLSASEQVRPTVENQAVVDQVSRIAKASEAGSASGNKRKAEIELAR